MAEARADPALGLVPAGRSVFWLPAAAGSCCGLAQRDRNAAGLRPTPPPAR